MRAVSISFLAGLVLLLGAAGAQALDINQDVILPPAEVGTYYEFEFEGEEGCIQSYYTRFSSGELPPGLEVTRDLMLRGTPTQSGLYSFYVELADEGCPELSVPSQGQFTLDVLPDLAVATPALPAAVVGVPYSFTLQMSGWEGGYDPPSWQVLDGALPAGLSLSPQGVISGTPTAAGASQVLIRIAEPFRRTGDKLFGFTVVTPLAAAPQRRTPAEVAVPLSAQLASSGGLAPVTWAITSGSLPKGLALAPTGAITGRPATAGAFTIVARATDALGMSATTTVRLDVAQRLTIPATTLPAAQKGVAYRAALRTTGGARPVGWSVSRGKLPEGIRLGKADGTLRGAARGAARRYRFTVRAVDPRGGVATRALVLDVTR